MLHLRRAVLGMAAALTLQQAHGQSDARRSAEQKVEFSRALVTTSPVAARIKASSSDEARDLLRQGAELQQAAESALRAGDIAGADRDANRAILLVGRARQLCADSRRPGGSRAARGCACPCPPGVQRTAV